MAERSLCVAAGGKGDERGAWRTQASPSSEGIGGGCTAEEVLADLAWVTLQHFHLDRIKLPIISAFQEIGETYG